ncbi:MAG: hypothetical protein ACU84J_07285 [Gammaproteobacteria bacterium]
MNKHSFRKTRVYVTWGGLDVNIDALKQWADFTAAMNERDPNTKPKAIQNWVSQVWPFAHEIRPGDWVILPLASASYLFRQSFRKLPDPSVR